MPSAWSITLGILSPLPSALSCHLAGTRQTITVVAKCERLWQRGNGHGNGRVRCTWQCLPSVPLSALGKQKRLWRPPHRNGRLRACAVHVTLFAECLFQTLSKDGLCRVPAGQHSAKSGFAECQLAGTRQRFIPLSASCSPSAFWWALDK